MKQLNNKCKCPPSVFSLFASSVARPISRSPYQLVRFANQFPITARPSGETISRCARPTGLSGQSVNHGTTVWSSRHSDPTGLCAIPTIRFRLADTYEPQQPARSVSPSLTNRPSGDLVSLTRFYAISFLPGSYRAVQSPWPDRPSVLPGGLTIGNAIETNESFGLSRTSGHLTFLAIP